MKKLLVIAAVCVVFLLPVSRPAAEKAVAGWNLTQSLGASINPLGLDAATRLFYTLPLFPARTGALWDSARIEAGFHNSLTPSYDTFSAFIRFEPAAVFDLHLSAGIRSFYDTFAFGYTPLAGYDVPFDSSTRADLDRTGAAGFRYSATPTLKGGAGPFLFASATGFVLFDMRGADPDEDHYFEPVSNAVLKKFDGYITNDTLVLYDFGRGILGGVSHYFLYVPGSEYVSRRVTLICHVSRALGRNMTGTLSVMGGTYLRDRYNTWRDGRMYAAVQAGVGLKLGESPAP